MKRKLHYRVNVRKALRRCDRDIYGYLFHETGRLMSGSEVRETMTRALLEGKECVPTRPTGDCPDFDYSGTGCPGHETKEVETC